MAEAIIGGILSSELVDAQDIIACDKSEERRALIGEQYNLQTTENAAEMAGACNVIVLAVKPQDMEELLTELRPCFKSEHLLISIAAGRKLEFLRRICGAEPRLARVMPNLALMAGEGMSVFCLDEKADEKDREITASIFGSAGAVLEMDESHFDAVTAVSGSGPAFVAFLLQAFVDGALQLGLGADEARLLAEQTMIGTAVYLQESGRDINEFINAVCSPKGTTEAGMRVLSASDVDQTLARTLDAAASRSRELS